MLCAVRALAYKSQSIPAQPVVPAHTQVVSAWQDTGGTRRKWIRTLAQKAFQAPIASRRTWDLFSCSVCLSIVADVLAQKVRMKERKANGTNEAWPRKAKRFRDADPPPPLPPPASALVATGRCRPYCPSALCPPVQPSLSTFSSFLLLNAPFSSS